MSVAEGEVLAIIGANGAGKTTLLRSISGLMQNDPGQIRYRGEAIGALRADQVAMRGIALVPEGRQLFPSLSVEENLLIGGQGGRDGPWSLEVVFALFPMLLERRAVPSTSLSGGQQQMVAIGRALVANPGLILFDEISLGLAPVIIKSIYETLPDIVGSGMSAVIVEQDISKALSVSSRVYCLQEGRISLEAASKTVSREMISRAYFGIA
ncbi:MAG: ABC transporter ATP-binding protein [Geminicoccaceae bacterium]